MLKNRYLLPYLPSCCWLSETAGWPHLNSLSWHFSSFRKQKEIKFPIIILLKFELTNTKPNICFPYNPIRFSEAINRLSFWARSFGFPWLTAQQSYLVFCYYFRRATSGWVGSCYSSELQFRISCFNFDSTAAVKVFMSNTLRAVDSENSTTTFSDMATWRNSYNWIMQLNMNFTCFLD